MKFYLFIIILFFGFSLKAQEYQTCLKRQLIPNLDAPKQVKKNAILILKESIKGISNTKLKKKLQPDLSIQPSAVRNVNYQKITNKNSIKLNSTKTTIHLSKNELPSLEIPIAIKEN